MKKFIFSSISVLLLAACGSETTTTPAAASAQAQPVTTQSNQSIVRVVAEPYVPFITRTTSGAINGFDYDLLTAIAEKENLQLQFIPQAWAVLFNTLETGNAEIAAGGIYITEERKKRFDLTEPYLETGTILLVGKDAKINELNDIRGKTITVQTATVAERILQDFSKGTVTVEARDTLWLAISDVLAHKADAVFGNSGPLTHYAAHLQDKGVKLVTNTDQPIENYAFLVKKGNTELLNKLNSGLAKTKKDGTYDKLYQKWFKDTHAAYSDK